MQNGLLAAGLFALAGTTHAATIDLTDAQFSAVTYETFVQGPIGPVVAFDETVDGVTFAFERLGGQFRKIAVWGDGNTGAPPFVMDVGGGGGSVTGFTLVASQDVTLEAFSGFAQQFNDAPIFDVTGAGVTSTGNAFSVTGFVGSATPGTDSFAGGALSLLAGEVYTFVVTNSGVVTTGYFTGFEFSTTPVPLPAALPVMLSALAGLAAVRRRS